MLKREGYTGSSCSFLLAFHGEGSGSPWRVIRDATFVENFLLSFFLVLKLWRGCWKSTETSASSLNFIYVNGGGSGDKKGRKKEKEGRGFGRLPSFFFPPFLFVFSKFFSTCEFGPNLVVFLLFWGFDYFRILEIFYCNLPLSTPFPLSCPISSLSTFISYLFTKPDSRLSLLTSFRLS